MVYTVIAVTMCDVITPSLDHRMCSATHDSLFSNFFLFNIIITHIIKETVVFIFLVAVIMWNEDVVFMIPSGTAGQPISTVHALMVTKCFL